MNEYIKLLKSNHIVKTLSSVQLIAYFGAWFSNVAIYTLLLDMKVDAQVIAFVAMLHFLSGVLQAPFSGAIIDSFKPKRLLLSLIVLEMLSTLLFLFVDSISDLNLLYLLVFIKMASASFYFTTEMSLLPKILDDIQLKKANELHSIIWSASYTLGMTTGGFIVFYFGIKAAFLLDAMMFLIAFVLLFNLKINVEHIGTKEKLFKMMGDTFVYLKKYPKAIHLMLLHSFVGFSAYDALIALMADKYYASIVAASLSIGLLNASRAIGLVIGPMILGRWVDNGRLLYIFLAQGIALYIWAVFMQNFYLSLAASVFVGLFTTTLWSYTYTLLQKNIEPTYYGRIVAYNDMLFLSSASVASYMIGFLVAKEYSLEFVTFVMGSVFIVGGVYFVWIMKNYDLGES